MRTKGVRRGGRPLLVIGGAAGPASCARFVVAGRRPSRVRRGHRHRQRAPGRAGGRYTSVFAELGAGSVPSLRLETRAQANDPAVAAALAAATGVFFTGGDQLRITTIIGGTLTDSVLQSLVGRGSVVLAGTSAGAAMMSGTMIVGGDGYGVTTGPGLEFLPGVLIDMHFAERGRLNRLLSAVARYPHELGLGIDEDTAILADGDHFEVLGSGSVTVVDAGAATDIRAPADGPIALADARIHVLPAGCRFDLPAAVRRSSTYPPGNGDEPHEDP